jgi:hypothetical protein
MTEARLRAIVTTLVAAIAALAFLVSFRAISQFAVTTGAFPHSLGWAAPLLVDSFTLAASIEVLRSTLAGQRAVYPWCLVAGATAASAALNVAHAPDHPAAQAIAGIPPVALLLALELLMRGARLYLAVQGVDSEPEPDTARERLRAWLAVNPSTPLTARQAAELLGVSRSRAGCCCSRSAPARTASEASSDDRDHAAVGTDHAGGLRHRGALPARGLVAARRTRGAQTGLACGAAPGDPEPRTRTGRLPAGRAASWTPPASRPLRVPTGWPAASLDPAVVQEARSHRSPGAGEEPSPTSRQEARTVADQAGTPTPAGTC